MAAPGSAAWPPPGPPHEHPAGEGALNRLFGSSDEPAAPPSPTERGLLRLGTGQAPSAGPGGTAPVRGRPLPAAVAAGGWGGLGFPQLPTHRFEPSLQAAGKRRSRFAETTHGPGQARRAPKAGGEHVEWRKKADGHRNHEEHPSKLFRIKFCPKSKNSSEALHAKLLLL